MDSLEYEYPYFHISSIRVIWWCNEGLRSFCEQLCCPLAIELNVPLGVHDPRER